jgi:anti-sigma B factor antagonist
VSAPAQSFAVSVAERDRGIPWVTVHGDVDMSTAPQLEQALDDVHRRFRKSATLDFADLGFIDSSGLRVLLLAARREHRAGRRLRVVNVIPQVRRLFGLVALDRSLDL